MDCSSPGSSVHGISQAEYWSRLPGPSPGDLPDPGIEPRSPWWQADSLLAEPSGKLAISWKSTILLHTSMAWKFFQEKYFFKKTLHLVYETLHGLALSSSLATSSTLFPIVSTMFDFCVWFSFCLEGSRQFQILPFLFHLGILKSRKPLWESFLQYHVCLFHALCYSCKFEFISIIFLILKTQTSGKHLYLELE